MPDQNTGCCKGSGCCTPVPEKKKITIDFLYLDLSVCERCQGTDSNLDDAISDVSSVLSSAGYDAVINKVNITSAALAEKYAFMSSPTIRINGKDIEVDVSESNCTDCGTLCGDSVDCRVFTYEGNHYDSPPKGMIVNAILKEVYGSKSEQSKTEAAYVLPENLRLFFESQSRKNGG
ncbi:MAG: DUF2703 domain-containing protein [Eubacteriales bacterium]